MLALGFVYPTVLPWQRGNYHLYGNRNRLVWFEHDGTHVTTRFKTQNLEALVSNRICCPPSHCEQTGSCPEPQRHNTSNKWNKQQTFPFSPPLNDNFRAPRDKREFGNEKNGMARQTAQRDGAGGFSAICFSPDLTMHLINWLFSFNAVFPAPPVATPRGKAA